MTPTGITATVILFLLFGIAVPAFAHQDQREDHPKNEHPQQTEHQQPAHPPSHAQPEHAQTQQHAHPPQHTEQAHPQPNAQAQPAEHPAHPPQQATHHATEPPHSGAPNPPAAHHPTRAHHAPPNATQQRANAAVWQQHRAQNWQAEHRTWEQRGGYRGYRIPDARFSTYFGDSHRFRIYGLPFENVGGYPRFRYHGYWFQMLDPWPYDWANNWFDTDPVYITWMDGGYYLIDPRYPDYPLAVEILQ